MYTGEYTYIYTQIQIYESRNISNIHTQYPKHGKGKDTWKDTYI